MVRKLQGMLAPTCGRAIPEQAASLALWKVSGLRWETMTKQSWDATAAERNIFSMIQRSKVNWPRMLLGAHTKERTIMKPKRSPLHRHTTIVSAGSGRATEASWESPVQYALSGVVSVA